jgi:phage tail sheath protein FI
MAGVVADKKAAKPAVRQDYFEKRHPGVYREETFGSARRMRFFTGVPAFLGLTPSAPRSGPAKRYAPVLLSLWPQFEHHIGKPRGDSFLSYAVRGFFENGGRRCYVVPLEDNTLISLMKGLEAIEPMNTVDLVCTPDLVTDKDTAFDSQQVVVDHCERLGDRFAILDSLRGDNSDQVWQQWSDIDGRNGAIYYPWVKVPGYDGGYDLVPPCGHVAGVYARTDRLRGVHKAPANEILEGVVGLERVLTNREQDDLNPKRVNCLRSFPGRGIRVWGARTLSGQTAWTYVNVRRVFLTAVRWIDWNMWDVVFESSKPSLWARIERELTTYFMGQFRAGALKGGTPQEAFYVKCNAETNPPELRDSGQVVTEIGLAPTVPYEFVVIRLIHGARGVTISGPSGSA